ncbi:hypothetical protein PanWU01x14_021310 [Parasponia andersonii]|uniref:Uncharacterized protein n=1 Tax=Parasponia andersonii TaxID=3476 RepID=A0A2P5DXZ1_PARAD|nr:hypothetical protein PanWU01x14_021310 [Parasponia andersonii]
MGPLRLLLVLRSLLLLLVCQIELRKPRSFNLAPGSQSGKGSARSSYPLDFSDPKWDRARNQLQGLVEHCLDPLLQRRRPGLGSYREQTGHYHSDVFLRVRSKLAPRHRLPLAHLECGHFRDMLASFDFAQLLIPRTFSRQLTLHTFSRVIDGRRESQSASTFEQLTLRTFSRVVDGRRESQSASTFEVYWQVLALHSSSLFARFLRSLTGDVSPRLRALSSSLFPRFLGSSTGDVSPRVRALSRSAGKFWLCTAAHSSQVFSGRRRAT